MPHPKNQVLTICEGCGKEFSHKASLHPRYCSLECRTQSKTFMTTCPQCGKPFRTYLKHPQKYCSISCAITSRNLTDQNPSFHRDISGEKNPICHGHALKGAANGMYGRIRELNPAWKGGRKIRKDGYVMVYAPDHPNNCEGYVLEHRLVMERHLGRLLSPTEVVHHIDDNPLNNVIDNLRLFASQAAHIKNGHH